MQETSNFRVRKVSNGVITTVAGNGTFDESGDGGPATAAGLGQPQRIAFDSAGNLYIAATNLKGHIRRITDGVITTVATDPGAGGIAVDATGIFYAIRSTGVDRIANGAITSIAGNGKFGFSGDGGPATSSQLNTSSDVVVDSAGNIYIADSANNRVRILTPGAKPTINPNGIVPVYSTTRVLQPGSWVSIYGSNLASTTTLWNGDFPTSLGGTSVTIDNKPAYLWFVSPNQINLQVPDDSATGLVSVAVTTQSGTTTSTVTLAPQAPSFSLLGDGTHVAAEIATPNGSGAYANGTYDLLGPASTFSFATRPVKAGETLTLFGVGFGITAPAVPAGKVFSGSAPTVNPVTVTIGGVKANVSYSGITQAGLYQINLTVPLNAPSGDQALQATANGVQTPAGPVVTVQ